MATQGELTTYIALFHHRDNAASAIRELEALGFTPSALSVIGGGNGSTYSEAAGTFGKDYGYGSQGGLAEIGVPEADRKHLHDGLARGGIVVSLEASGERANEIEKIFSKHSTRKIDERVLETTPYVAPLVAAPALAAALEEMVIPVAQEELVVGKREVDRGGVRVYRHIVEKPVSETVSLREERIFIDRQPVNRAATESDLLERDRFIEFTETAEEAVVTKTARVVEEIHVGTTATDHTETVHDTVRPTEVEVEQLGSVDSSLTNQKY